MTEVKFEEADKEEFPVVLTETIFKEMIAHVTNNRLDYSRMTPLESHFVGRGCNLGNRF